MDGPGENKKLQLRSESSAWKLNLQFEITARDTPQQNHLAELGFASLANKGRALMYQANIPLSVRYKVFKEAFKTATLLDGLMTTRLDNKLATRYIHFFGKNPSFAQHLRTWGEAGTVKIKVKATPKIADRGVQCMFIGYALDHTGDTYRMWNPITSGVHETRDVIWLKRMFYETPILVHDLAVADEDVEVSIPQHEAGESIQTRVNQQVQTQVGVEDPDESLEESDDESEASATTPVAANTRSGRRIIKPTRLIKETGAIMPDLDLEEYEIKLTRAEERYYEAMTHLQEGEFIPEEINCVGAGIGGGFANTKELHVMKFKQAMATEDVKHWERAVDEEHDRMIKHRVWQAVLKRDIPRAVKIMTSTWAMKKKANGTYRARINARGYEQVDGLHYDSHDISAPVTNDVTIRIVLTLMIMATWIGEILDVEGAFLHGDFDTGKNVYMKVPEGFEKYYDPMYYVLLLLQTLYGLKQSAMAFWKKLLQAFQSMSFERSKADLCLYFAWTKEGLILWLSWIDDCLVVGQTEGVKKAKKMMTD